MSTERMDDNQGITRIGHAGVSVTIKLCLKI
jgi:hypothetical protein